MHNVTLHLPLFLESKGIELVCVVSAGDLEHQFVGMSGGYIVELLTNGNGEKTTKSPVCPILLMFSISSVEGFFSAAGEETLPGSNCSFCLSNSVQQLPCL